VRLVLVLDGIVVPDRLGDPPPEVALAARRLAAAHAPTLCAARFRPSSEGSWRFLGIDPLPNLQAFGEPLLDAVQTWSAPS